MEKFLTNSHNKTDLLHFLAVEWSFQDYVARALTDSDRDVFLTDGKECLRFACDSDGRLQTVVVPDLQCYHKGADTRLILHACHASKLITTS